MSSERSEIWVSERKVSTQPKLTKNKIQIRTFRSPVFQRKRPEPETYFSFVTWPAKSILNRFEFAATVTGKFQIENAAIEPQQIRRLKFQKPTNFIFF